VRLADDRGLFSFGYIRPVLKYGNPIRRSFLFFLGLPLVIMCALNWDCVFWGVPLLEAARLDPVEDKPLLQEKQLACPICCALAARLSRQLTQSRAVVSIAG